MIWQTALRALLGVGLAGVGYFLIDRFIPPISIFGSELIVPASIAAGLGLLGVYLVPAISVVSRRLFDRFVQLLARELAALIKIPRMIRREEPKSSYRNPLILDTSVIIDGRIAEVAKTGFLDGTILIPRFILLELQHIADSADPVRRGRGRRGFEVLDQLRGTPGVKVEVISTDFPKLTAADDKLLELGKKLRGRVMTTDYNLNKVASIAGVRILNVNELANSIKTTLLPGESIAVKVIQAGKERGQGVGYLPDGTMIVVEGGARLVGEEVKAEVSRVFQTVAGRMVFVKPKAR